MSICVYDTYAGQAFGIVQIIPWVIPSFMTAASITKDRRGRWGFEFTPFWFSFYLTFCQLAIYLLQYSFRAVREDPFCTGVMSAAFPSTATFFVACGVFFLVFFTYIWNIVLNWKYWVYLLVCVLVPPCYLVWLEYNSWWEILVSAALGITTTLIYFLLLFHCMQPVMPELLNATPCTWFSVTDTYLMNAAQEERAEFLRQRYKEADEVLDRLRGRLE